MQSSNYITKIDARYDYVPVPKSNRRHQGTISSRVTADENDSLPVQKNTITKMKKKVSGRSTMKLLDILKENLNSRNALSNSAMGKDKLFDSPDTKHLTVLTSADFSKTSEVKSVLKYPIKNATEPDEQDEDEEVFVQNERLRMKNKNSSHSESLSPPLNY